jgi:hypothetical protein
MKIFKLVVSRIKLPAEFEFELKFEKKKFFFRVTSQSMQKVHTN